VNLQERMPFTMKRGTWCCVALLLASAMGAAGQAASGPVMFAPGPDLLQRYQSPTPGPGATNPSKKAVIGSGNATINTGDAKNSFWTEPVDLTGTGAGASADMLWDASSRIFYTYSRTNVRCSHGKSVEAGVLVGIYGKKNILGKTAGSGWWVVDLQEGQCQAPLAGLYGCKFNASGGNTACGRTELDTRINDMSIVESTRF
jgi:hypothetical protein